jgi:hypothetical protein
MDCMMQISGESVFLLEDTEIRLRPGAWLIMNGVPHSSRNDLSDPAVLVGVVIGARHDGVPLRTPGPVTLSPALPVPLPSCSLRDGQAALSAWDPAARGQFSLGILPGQRLAGRTRRDGMAPPQPRRNPGSGWSSALAMTRRSRSPSAPATPSNGTFPGTAATGQARTPDTIHGTTASSGPSVSDQGSV